MRKITVECISWWRILTRDTDWELLWDNKVIDDFKRNAHLIILDGKEHTSEIEVVYSWDVKERQLIVWPGKDGVLCINHTRDENYTIITPLADCWGIAFKNPNNTAFGMVHAWYKWVAKDIIWELVDKIWRTWTHESQFEFELSPMLWKRYEFKTSHYLETFRNLFEKYELNSNDYFEEIDAEKWYLNLKKIILDVFKKNKIKRSQIKISNIETNNPKNNYASNRLETIAKNIKEKILEKYWEQQIIDQAFLEDLVKLNIFNDQEQELIKSWNYDHYTNTKRNLFMLKLEIEKTKSK